MTKWLASLPGVSPATIPKFVQAALHEFTNAADAWSRCDDAAALLWLAYHASPDRRADVAQLVDELAAELSQGPASRVDGSSSGPVSAWTNDPTGAATYDVALLLRQSIGQRTSDVPASSSITEGQRVRYTELVRAKMRVLAPRIRGAFAPFR
jgi:hypothetical protein